MADQSFDLVIVGGGPGGYVAAIRAAQLGMKTALVERDQLGGICLNWGCIPTKALLRASEINHMLHRLPDFGFAPVESRFEIDKVVKRSRAVAKQLSSGVGHLMRKNKITVFDGTAKLAGKQTLAVEKAGAPVATNPAGGAPSGQPTTELGTVVVTGSRIARRDYQSTSPLVTLTSQNLTQQADLNIQTTLNKLPQFQNSSSPSRPPSRPYPLSRYPPKPQAASNKFVLFT